MWGRTSTPNLIARYARDFHKQSVYTSVSSVNIFWILPISEALNCRNVFGASSRGVESVDVHVDFDNRCGGYVLFRWTNYQKDAFRRLIAWRDNIAKTTFEKALVDARVLWFWRKKATYILAKYKTKDGIQRTSYLLTSGFWGQARHMNYTGDIILSLMWCVSCGFTHILPYFYFFYIVTLLVSRTFRDETRCKGKYGEDVWNAYCKKVPYRFIPYVF